MAGAAPRGRPIEVVTTCWDVNGSPGGTQTLANLRRLSIADRCTVWSLSEIIACAAFAFTLVVANNAMASQPVPLDPNPNSANTVVGVHIPPYLTPVGFAPLNGSNSSHYVAFTARYRSDISSSGPSNNGIVLLEVVDPNSGAVSFSNQTLGVQSVSPPLAVDIDKDGIDEVALWAGGRLMIFNLNGTILANWVLDADANSLAPTPEIGVARSIAGDEEFILEGRQGDVMRVSLTGSVIWRTHLAARPLVGGVLVWDFDGDNQTEIAVADGSWAPNLPEDLAIQGFTFLGNSTYLLDAITGVVIRNVSIPGAFSWLDAPFGTTNPTFDTAGSGGAVEIWETNQPGDLFVISLGRGVGTVSLIDGSAGPVGGISACRGSNGAAPLLYFARAQGTTSTVIGKNGSSTPLSISIPGGFIQSMAALPPAEAGHPCNVVLVNNSLSLLEGGTGAPLGAFPLGTPAPRSVRGIDFDADGFSELVVTGFDPAAGASGEEWVGFLDISNPPLSISNRPAGDIVDIFPGGVVWTNLTVSVSGFPVQTEMRGIAIVMAPDNGGASYDFQAASFGIPAKDRDFLVDAANSTVAFSVSVLIIRIRIGADWAYGGPPNGSLALRISLTNRSSFLLPIERTAAIHMQVELVNDPALETAGRTLGNEDWITSTNQLNLSAGPLRYLGTNQLVPSFSVRWNLTVRPTSNASAGTDPQGYFRAVWSFPLFGPGVENGSVALSIGFGTRSLALVNWTIRIDRLIPTILRVEVATSSGGWFQSSNVSVGVMACDEGSGVNDSTIGFLDGMGAMIGGTAELVVSLGNGCYDVLILHQFLPGNTTFGVTVGDLAGNVNATSPSYPLRIDPYGISYGSFLPSAWVNHTSPVVSIAVADAGGSGINLSTLAISIRGSPTDTPNFVPLGVQGFSVETTVTYATQLESDGVFLVQYRGYDRAGNGPAFSEVYLLRVDASAPVLTNDDWCSPAVRNESRIAMAFRAEDNSSGIALERSFFVLLDSGGATLAFPIEAQNYTISRGGRILSVFSAMTLLPGNSTLIFDLWDRAGNELRVTCGLFYNVPPRVTIEGVADGQAIESGTVISVMVGVVDPDGSTWNLTATYDGIPLVGGPCYSIPITLGNHSLRVVVRDEYGAVNTSEVDFVGRAPSAQVPLSPPFALFAAIIGVVVLAVFLAYRIGRRRAE
jgi:hypothetical protein